MSQSAVASARTAPVKAGRGAIVLLTVCLVASLVFVIGFALPYFGLDQAQFGPYWAKRFWLLSHIGSGMVALFLGPFVIWLGLNRRRLPVHRGIGMLYVGSGALSCIAALNLSLRTDFGLVFGMGLSGLAIAWFVTTGMALVAIKRRLIEQHQEWMTRSYVVMFGFVNFRILVGILQAAGVGTLLEQLTAASWFCWAFPLLVTEVALQGRRIFKRSRPI